MSDIDDFIRVLRDPSYNYTGPGAAEARRIAAGIERLTADSKRLDFVLDYQATVYMQPSPAGGLEYVILDYQGKWMGHGDTSRKAIDAAMKEAGDG